MQTITQLSQAFSSGTKTARQLVQEALDQLQARASFHATLSTVEARALERADQLDADRAAGKSLGRLAGVPFIAKDNFLTFGGPTTAASHMLEQFEAPFQATAVERLEAEGAILIAKANLDAFAHGGSTENSYFGPTKNPHDPTKVPGGSSGGSATVVALDIVPFALGTDTGGSIRQPASFCGVVGAKPTYGRVSRYGVVAMASSTDTIGVLSSTIEDAAAVMEIISGQDDRDSTTLPDAVPTFLPSATPKNLKIGLIDEYMGEALSAEVRVNIEKRIADLRQLGHTVETIRLPSLSFALAIYYIIVPAEISSNLARYDGIRYGLASEADTLQQAYLQSRSEGFMPENKRRILIGNYVLSSGYYDAYYRKAQTARTLLVREFTQAFEHFDMLVGPVTPTTAFALGERSDDPLEMYLADIMTVSASLSGLPALSVPSGRAKNNMPVGLQLIGAQQQEPLLFSVAKQLQELDRG
jgi:aspartyl-tRNA(Asn)/glutamyl-tRNA(Gln) amidotransferase subunit A